MRFHRWLVGVVAALVCIASVTGCGSEKDKGVNKGKDQPQQQPASKS